MFCAFSNFCPVMWAARSAIGKLAKLTPADIRAFITLRRAEGLSPRSVKRVVSSVRGFFRYLAREEILDNPAPRKVSARRARAAPCRGL